MVSEIRCVFLHPPQFDSVHSVQGHWGFLYWSFKRPSDNTHIWNFITSVCDTHEQFAWSVMVCNHCYALFYHSRYSDCPPSLTAFYCTFIFVAVTVFLSFIKGNVHERKALQVRWSHSHAFWPFMFSIFTFFHKALEAEKSSCVCARSNESSNGLVVHSPVQSCDVNATRSTKPTGPLNKIWPSRLSPVCCIHFLSLPCLSLRLMSFSGSFIEALQTPN